MKTFVIIADSHYRCVGTSVTCFDDSGLCLEPELPWVCFRDFVIADQIAEPLNEISFYGNVPADPFIEAEIEGHYCDYFQVDGVYMIYDAETDVYYFFI